MAKLNSKTRIEPLIEKCPNLAACPCGGDLVPICAVNDRDSIKRYLEHIGIDSDPPQQAPPQRTQESFDFQDHDSSQDDYPVIELD